MAAKREVEPLLWLLFSAGGVLAAFLGPILLLLFALVFPLVPAWRPDHERLLGLLDNSVTGWLVRLVLFFLCMLSLFHWAHRFRYTLYDGLQIKHLNELINLLCYGVAIGGSVVAGYLLFWRLP